MGSARLRRAIQRALLISGFIIFGPAAVAKEAAKTELHLIQTITLTDEQFLAGKKDGKPTVIAGELRLPSLATDRLPAMVIVHGSGGILGNDDHWARELGDMGIATFIIDGFTPRGISNTGADQSQLGLLTMIYDSYRALDLLAKHPRIDPERIGIMGGSRGGLVALYAALKRFQGTYGSGREFAVYLPFYAVCGMRFLDDENVSEKPIRLFHGSADDYVPVAPCRSYVARLTKAGKNVRLTEYSGAYHLFDDPIYPLRNLPQGLTGRKCAFEERSPGNIVNAATGAPFSYSDPCFERGAMVGYDAAAHAASIIAVKEILRTAFKLKE